MKGTPRSIHDLQASSCPAGEISSRPDELRAGSSPSPPPRSIRPVVRRLLWLPHFMGSGYRSAAALLVVRVRPAAEPPFGGGSITNNVCATYRSY